jgi:hypothetical protein
VLGLFIVGFGMGGTVDIGNWGKDKWVVGFGRLRGRSLVVANTMWGDKEEGDGLLGSEGVNSRLEMSVS